MFTGIVSSIGRIVSAERRGDLTLVIACDYAPETLRIGDSVACNGCCLTVVEKRIQDPGFRIQEETLPLNPESRILNPTLFTVQLSAETLARTAPGQWQAGKTLNLERALRLGDTLDGHMVTGHVDGVATLLEVTKQGDSHRLGLEAPPALARFIAEKGSVTLDGVALTVNKVEDARFWVNIIPHTWAVTTLGMRQPGDALNLEIDMIARYVARLLQK